MELRYVDDLDGDGEIFEYFQMLRAALRKPPDGCVDLSNNNDPLVRDYHTMVWEVCGERL